MTGLLMILAAGDENHFGDTRSGGLAGPTGLVIILFLVLGTVLLIRNMNTHLKRVPERFDNETPAGTNGMDKAEEPPADPADPTDTK